MTAGALRNGAVAAALAVVVVWTAREAWSSGGLPVAAPIVVSTAFLERYDTLHRNETLSQLLARHNIVGADLYRFLAASEFPPRRMRAGQEFRFRYPVDGARADRVRVRLNDDELVRLARDSAGDWRRETVDIRWTTHLEYAAGTITGSLDETLRRLVPDSLLPGWQRSQLTWDLADGVFGFVIDFTRDLYPDDRVEVLYERLTSHLGDVRYGRVVAARITSRGELRPAYLMPDERGRNAYYDAEGNSLRRAFRMYPVHYRYISSGFSRSRVHPILRVERPHLGVDYRASQGTEVRATGDGTVIRAGRWGGYGIMVAIRHPKGIETRYAHLRGIAPGIRVGQRVQQDQIIGYVGMTGLATAPHVHYEFIQGGRHVDPRRAVRYGTADPVPASRRAHFEALRASYDRLLTSFGSRVATSAGVD